MTVEYGPRIRAARGFAGMSQGDLAGALRREVQWVKRRESGEQDASPDLPAIAHATGVPLLFLQEGWSSLDPTADPSLSERVEALEGRMNTIYEIALNRIGTDLGSLPAPSEGSEAERNVDRPR